MGRTRFNLGDNIIDSRDVITRIEELESDLADLKQAVEDASELGLLNKHPSYRTTVVWRHPIAFGNRSCSRGSSYDFPYTTDRTNPSG